DRCRGNRLQRGLEPRQNVLARVPDEVLALDRELDGARERVGRPQQGPPHERPELATPRRAHSDAPQGAEENAQAPRAPAERRLWPPDRVDEKLTAFAERSRAVQICEQIGVPGEERALVHG